MKFYEEPVLEVKVIELEDVIAVSGDDIIDEPGDDI